jgi:hypothetical protein
MLFTKNYHTTKEMDSFHNPRVYTFIADELNDELIQSWKNAITEIMLNRKDDNRTQQHVLWFVHTIINSLRNAPRFKAEYEQAQHTLHNLIAPPSEQTNAAHQDQPPVALPTTFDEFDQWQENVLKATLEVARKGSLPIGAGGLGLRELSMYSENTLAEIIERQTSAENVTYKLQAISILQGYAFGQPVLSYSAVVEDGAIKISKAHSDMLKLMTKEQQAKKLNAQETALLLEYLGKANIFLRLDATATSYLGEALTGHPYRSIENGTSSADPQKKKSNQASTDPIKLANVQKALQEVIDSIEKEKKKLTPKLS